MNAQAFRALAEESSAERRKLILDAAERSFARSGFHRTTMQDVAVEAGMSPGNLYRYFASKDALVAGLCERDRGNLSGEFAEVKNSGADFLAAFKDLGRRHFESTPRNCSKAKLCMEIWAEAARNPEIAKVQNDFDRTFEEQLVEAFETAKREGGIHPDVNIRGVASIISKLGDGLFVRRAVSKDFDPDREVAEVFAVIGALLTGAIRIPTSETKTTDPASTSGSTP